MSNSKNGTARTGAKSAQAKPSTTIKEVKTELPKEEPKKLNASERVSRLEAFQGLARKLKIAKERKTLVEQFLTEAWEDGITVQFRVHGQTVFETENGDLAEEAAKCVKVRITDFIEETEHEIEAFEI